MGAGESSPEETEFPYFQMLQWAAMALPENSVMTYDIEAAKKAIAEIPDDEQALLNTDDELKLKCFEGSDREVWEDWAETLLETDAALADFRFKLVPRKIQEDLFWRKYFGRAKTLLLATVNRET